MIFLALLAAYAFTVSSLLLILTVASVIYLLSRPGFAGPNWPGGILCLAMVVLVILLIVGVGG